MQNKTISYRFVKYFLDNRQLTILLLFVVIIGGIYSYSQLRTEGFPSISVPIIMINTILPGAGPETIANTITTVLENALSDLDELKEYSSTTRNNVSTIILTLNDANNISNVVQEVRTKIDSVTLPEGASNPSIFVPEVGGPVFIMAVTGNVHIQDLLEDGKLITEQLQTIDGIQAIDRFSDIETKIYVELEPQYQNPEILNQIKSANVAFPLGSTQIDGTNTPIAGSTKLIDIESLKTLPISISNRTGGVSVVELKDIAAVYSQLDFGGQIHRVGYQKTTNDGEIETNTFAVNGAVLYNVLTKPGTDVLRVEKEFLKEINKIETQYENIDIVLVFNQADQSRRQINEITHGAFGEKWEKFGTFGFIGYLFGGIWLLAIAMLLLVDWRSAILSIFAIPLSFLITFGFLRLFGIDLNTIVLFSLVLVLGLVIDPAIVVIESIKRYTEIGYDGVSSALRAATAVGKGVFIAVFTSFIVFVPFGIVGGTFGQIIKYIPLTVIPALIASYFVPMVFLTWLGVKFIKPKKDNIIYDEDDPRTLWPIARLLIRVNRFILRHLGLQITIIVLGLLIPIGLAVVLFGSGAVQQVQFSQAEDIEFVSVSVPLPPNTTNSQRLEIAREVEEIISHQGKYIKTFAYISLDGEQRAGDGSLSLFIELFQAGDRDKKSAVIASDMQKELVDRFGDLARAGQSENGPPQSAYPISVEIFNNDPLLLQSASLAIAEKLDTYEEVTAVRYDGQDTIDELTVVLDENEVARRGLTAPVIYGQIANILGENTLFDLGEDEVIIRYPVQEKPSSIQELEDVVIFSASGPVRLGDIGNVVNATVPSAISRIDGERYVSVSARVGDVRDVIDVQRRIDDWTKENVDSLGLSERDLVDRRGIDEFEKSFQQLFAAILFSILITYIIFAVFFKSFSQPFIILFAVPLIFVGAFPALVLFARGQFGFLETLGIIVLIGIVENVAIFLLDFANQRVETGMDKKEAIALSSGIRFRPIVLTQLTSLAGLLPLAVFSPFWRGLAVVVIAGITTSSILSLFTTPILYSWLTRKKKVNVDEQFVAQPHYEE